MSESWENKRDLLEEDLEDNEQQQYKLTRELEACYIDYKRIELLHKIEELTKEHASILTEMEELNMLEW